MTFLWDLFKLFISLTMLATLAMLAWKVFVFAWF